MKGHLKFRGTDKKITLKFTLNGFGQCGRTDVDKGQWQPVNTVLNTVP